MDVQAAAGREYLVAEETGEGLGGGWFSLAAHRGGYMLCLVGRWVVVVVVVVREGGDVGGGVVLGAKDYPTITVLCIVQLSCEYHRIYIQ